MRMRMAQKLTCRTAAATEAASVTSSSSGSTPGHAAARASPSARVRTVPKTRQPCGSAHWALAIKRACDGTPDLLQGLSCCAACTSAMATTGSPVGSTVQPNVFPDTVDQ